MGDTIKIGFDPDYFPLIEGYGLRYHHTSTEFQDVQEVLLKFTDIRAFREDAVATVLMSRTRMGQTTQYTYKVRRNVKQVVAEGGILGFARIEYLRPPVPGKRWTEEPNMHEVAALDAAMEVPAGKFFRCMRINTFIAGGDGGSAIRYYAPGIGYIYEEWSDENWGARVSLIAVEPPEPKR